MKEFLPILLAMLCLASALQAEEPAPASVAPEFTRSSRSLRRLAPPDKRDERDERDKRPGDSRDFRDSRPHRLQPRLEGIRFAHFFV